MKRFFSTLLSLLCVLLVATPSLAAPHVPSRAPAQSLPIWIGTPAKAPSSPTLAQVLAPPLAQVLAPSSHVRLYGAAGYGPIPPPGTAGFIPVSQGPGVLAAWQSPSSLGLGVTWANDLSGNGTTTNTNQYVSALSYSSSAAGGPIAINGTNTTLVFAANDVLPTISQALTAGTGVTTSAALTITAQQGRAVASGTNNTGGYLYLESGAVGTGGTGGSTGDVVLAAGANPWLEIGPNIGGYYFAGAPLIFYGSSILAPQFYQLAQTNASGIVPQNLTIQAQFQQGTDQGSAALNTPGSVVANFGVPYTTTHAGSEASFQVKRNGTLYGQFGAWMGAPTTYSAFWLGPGIVPAANNFAYLGDGVSQVYLNSPSLTGSIFFQLANSTIVSWTQASNIVFHEIVNGFSYQMLFNTAAAAASTPGFIDVIGQSPNASCSSSAACTPGSIYFDVGVPGATGSPSEAYTLFRRNSVPMVQIGADPGTSGADVGLWLGNVVPNAANYNILANSAQLYLAAPATSSSFVFLIANSASVQLDNATVAFEPAGAIGGGSTNLGSETVPWPLYNGSGATSANGIKLWNTTSDTSPETQLYSGALIFGSSSSQDTSITRASSSTVQISSNTNGNATLEVGGTSVNSNELSIQTALASVTESIVGVGPVGGSAATLFLQPQSPAASGNSTGGNVTVNLSAPTNSGSEASLRVQRGVGFTAAIAPLPGFGSTNSGLWLNPSASSLSFSNYTIGGSNTVTAVNGVTQVSLSVSNSVQAQVVNGFLEPSSMAGASLGQATQAWNVLAAEQWQVPATISTGVWQWSGAASGAGGNLEAFGQNAGSTGQAGGNIIAAAGSGTTTGTGGAVILYSGQSPSGTNGNIQFGFGSLNGANPGNGNTESASLSTSATPNGFYWAANTPSSVVVPFNTIWQTQAPNGGSGTLAQNTPGSFVVLLPVPGSVGTAGSEASLWVMRSGTTPAIASIGPITGNGTTTGALWLSPSNGGAGEATGNYALASDTTHGTFLNDTVQLNFRVGAGGGAYTANIMSTLVGAGSINSGWGGSSVSSQPFGFQVGTGVSVSGGSFTLVAADIQTPVIQLIGTPPSGTSTITLPDQNGFYLFDITAIKANLNSTHSINFKCGASGTAAGGNGGGTPGHNLAIVVCEFGAASAGTEIDLFN